MLKKFNMLALIVLLVFQTMIAPIAATAQGTIQSEPSVLSDGVLASEQGDLPEEGEVGSTQTVEFEWALNEQVEIDKVYTSEIPGNSRIEEEQNGELIYEEEAIGSFSATVDGVVSVQFNEGIEGLLEAEALTGAFEVEVIVEKKDSDEDKEIVEEDIDVDEADIKDEDEEIVDEEEEPIEGNEVEKDEEAVVDGEEENKDESESKNEEINEPLKKAEEIIDKAFPLGIQSDVSSLAEAEEKHGFSLELGKVTNLAGQPYEGNTILKPDDEFRLHMKWGFENGHKYVAGDTKEIDLPQGIHISKEMTGEIYDEDGNLVATYKITTEKKVEFKFTEFIENSSDITGDLEIIAKLDLDKVEVVENEAILEQIGEEGNLKIPVDMGEKKQTIEKTGEPGKSFNADEINWEVIVNKNNAQLTDAEIIDKLPAGTNYKEGSLKVTKIKTSLSGAILGDIEEVTGATATEADGKLTIPLDDGDFAYRIEYTTLINDEEVETFKNDVTLKDDTKDNPKASAEVTVKRNAPLKKSAVKEFDPITGIIEWEIQFNYNGKELTNETLVDEWKPAGELELVGEPVFTEMEIGEDGTATATENVGLPKDAIFESGEDQFSVSGINTNKAYKVTYQTKVTDRILGELKVSNVAGFGTNTIDGDGPGTLGNYYGVKTAGDVDYSKKTIDWNITLNQDHYPMNEITVTDRPGPGLTLQEGSIQITVGGVEYTDFEVKGTGNKNNPFTIEFPDTYTTSEEIHITYKTDYIPSQVQDNKPENSMDVAWRPGKGNDFITKENIKASTVLNDATKDISWKKGTYLPDSKEIEWTIFVNYQENSIADLNVLDKPQGNQAIVDGSVTVHELEITSDGTTKDGAEVTGATSVSDSELTVQLGGTSKAYKIVYKTKVPGDVQKEYTNIASVKDVNTEITPVTGEVGIAKHDTYADKSGVQDGKTVNWTIDVNLGQQEIKSLELEDAISGNQDYLEDTIKVYKASVDVKGKATKGDALVKGTDYDLMLEEKDGKDTFTVKWKGDYATVEEAFIVEYSTLFFAGHNEDVSNTYNVKGENPFSEGATTGGEESVKIEQLSSGSAQGTAGYLVIDKVDTTYDKDKKEEGTSKLAGAEFALIDPETNKVLKTATTDSDGKIDFGRLLLGDYIVKETKPPAGYISEGVEVEVKVYKKYESKVETTITTHTVGNYKPVFMIDLTKTSSGGVKLENVEFKVYDAATGGNEVGSGETDTDGNVLIQLLEPAEAGTYYVEEVATTTPEHHIPLTDRIKVEIGDSEKTPIKLDVKNTLYPGKGMLKKVDADTKDGLAGAVFEVFDKDKNVVDTITTIAGGSGVTKELPPGSYTVKEKTAPTGFTGSTTGYTLEIPEASSVEEYPITNEGTEEVIENQVKTTSIVLTKNDSINTSQFLEGAEFELTKVSGDYDLPSTTTAPTDKEGKVTFKDVKPGVYTVTEITTPGGYVEEEAKVSVEVTVTLDQVEVGTIVTAKASNDPLANVIPKKVDKESGVELSGAEFKVTDLNGGEVAGFTGSFKTNDDGTVSITGLPVGNYNLVETKAPTGYELDETPQPFEVTKVTKTVVINKTFNNDIIKGSVELTKVDGDTDQPLAGVGFTLTNISLINKGDLHLADTQTATSDSDGKVKFDNLRPGRYKIVESKKLNDYYQDHWKQNGYEFNINLADKDGKPYDFVFESEVKNYKLVDIAVEKKWNDLWTSIAPANADVDRPTEVKVDLLQNGTKIQDATIKATDDWKGTFTGLDAVDASGKKYTYTVKEQTEKGYNSEVAYGDVDEATKHKQSATIINTAKKISLVITKQDSVNEKLLTGAEFTLTYPDGTTTVTETTDENGVLTFTDLQPGIYSVVEKTPPAGYIANTTPFEVEVTLDNVEKSTVLTKTIQNKPFADVQFQKVDAETEVALTGAEFKVVDPSGDDVSGYTDLKVDENGKLSITGLPALSTGKYKLVETKAPKGYELNEVGVEFTVSTVADTETVNLNNYDNEIIKGSVTFVKKDADDKEMENVPFDLESSSLVNDKDDGYKKRHYTDKDGKMLVENLRPGTYKFTEVFPSGYQEYVSKDLEFTIDPTTKDKTDINLGEVTNYKFVDIDVTKKWVDGANAAEKRPTDVKLDLYRSINNDDPVKVEDTTLTLTGTSTGTNWTGKFKDLDAVDTNGNVYKYTVKEQNVDDYEQESIEGNMKVGFKITNVLLTSIEVEKAWEDDGETAHPNVTIELLRDGNEIDQIAVLKSPDLNAKFDDLPVYNAANGQKYVYTVKESDVTGYKQKGNVATGTGFKITNVRTGEKDIEVTKAWKDETNTANRPSSITVKLYQKLAADKDYSTALQTETISPKGEPETWEHTFKGLPEFDSEGKAYEYKVEEVAVPGYKSDVTSSGDNFTITNTREGEAKIDVAKIWNDAGNTDSDRPPSIEVELVKTDSKKFETSVEKKTLDEDNGWKHSFTKLDKYDAEGIPFTFEVKENNVDKAKYAVDVKEVRDGNFVITNTRTETTEVNGTKTWKDDNTTEDRPTIKVNLLQNGDIVDSKTITKGDSLEYSFTELAKYDDKGVAYKYTVTEDAVDGYETKVNGYNITNTRSEKTSIDVTKEWVDTEETAKRPGSITVELYQNGKTKVDTEIIRPDSNDVWKHTFTDLEKYDESGKAYDYSINELKVSGYDTKIVDFEITNTRVGTVEIAGEKIWNDADNVDGDRPEEITVQLLQDGMEVDTQEISITEDWEYTFGGLAEFDSTGKAYKYTVKEVMKTEDAARYDSKVSEDSKTITNTRIGTTSVEGTKIWKDGDATDRPDIQVNLLQNGTKIKDVKITKTDDLKYSFTGLVKYDDKGVAYKYTIDEEDVDGYTKEINGNDITNIRSADTSVKITKEWKDDNNATEKRPGAITVELFQNDKKDAIKTKVIRPTDEDVWKHTFDKLQKYDDEGVAYTYTVKELKVDGYTSAEPVKIDDGFKITNVRTGKTTVDVVKEWNDNNETDKRLDVTVELLQNGIKVVTDQKLNADGNWKHTFTDLDAFDDNGVEYEYTVREKAVAGYQQESIKGDAAKGYVITNVATTEVTGTKTWLDDNSKNRPDIKVNLLQNKKIIGSKTIVKDDNLEYNFTDLPKYDVTGAEYKYTIDEEDVEGYEKTIEGNNITNLRVGTTAVDITKLWKDDEDATEDRPETIKVNLLANGDFSAEHEVKKVDGWKLNISDLPKYDDQGKEIAYTIKEQDVAGYASDIDGFEITNTRADTKDIEITKTWLDTKETAKRPGSIEVELFRSIADGDKESVKTYEVKADVNWTLEVKALPSFDADGKAYTYEIEEVAVDGYETTINGFDITNLRVGETEVSGTKTWNEVDKQYRPDSITVNLLADGESTDNKTVVKADKNGDWKYTFNELDQFDSKGKEITYTVKEDNIKGYTSKADGMNITNAQESTEVTGKKTWNEVDQQYRPDSITVNLLVDDKKVADTKASEETDWKYIFADLAKYDKEGKIIKYTVEEAKVPGYASEVKDYNITNTQETTEVSGTKNWNEVDEQYRPDSITVQLFADDKLVADTEASEETDWEYNFTDLAKYDQEGKGINYTIEEVEIPGYESKVDGNNLTNTQRSTVVSGVKTWNEVDKQYRPDSITVNLLVDGEIVADKEASDKTDWKYSFTDLAKYDKEGNEINYTIDEVEVPGYVSKIDGTNITNTQESTIVSGEKTWVEVDEQYRPDSITVNLLVDGEKVADTKVSDDTEWKYSFTNLAKYDTEGKEINYTIEEGVVLGYKSEVEGNNLTNTQESTIVSGEKTWVEVDKQYRPDSIKVQLLANGEKVADTEASDETEWQYSFTDLAKYDKEGKEITYTIGEVEVPGYESEVEGNNLTNTQESTKVSGEKTWIEVDEQHRPTSITVNLLANGEKEDSVKVTNKSDWKFSFEDLAKYDSQGKEITYTIEEVEVLGFKSEVKDYNITNTQYSTEISGMKTWKDNDDATGDRPTEITVQVMNDTKVIQEQKVTAKDEWKYTFTDLAMYDFEGNEINYTINELPVPGYTTEVAGNDITNTRSEKVDVAGTKTWHDDEDATGDRPTKITVQLLANGEKEDSTVVNQDSDWKYAFTDLAAYDEDGVAIKYSVAEIKVDGYEANVNGYDIVNVRAETMLVSGTKSWLDEKIADRPETITINLLQNDSKIDSTVITSKDDANYSFIDVDVFDENGVAYEYVVEEDGVSGYKPIVDGYDITNLRVGTTEVTGEKSWVEVDEQYRPDSITVNLLANGEKVGTIEVSKDTDWKYSFTELSEYDQEGKEIEYTIEEVEVPGYVSKVEDYNIINTQETIEITGTKTWKDNEDATGDRPDSITVQVMNSTDVVQELEVTTEDDWNFTFTDLAKYDKKGIEIEYTINELPVPGYATEIDGSDITNTKVDQIDVVGTKTWKGDNAEDRPDSITVQLIANGEVLDSVDVTSETDWIYIFENVEAYDSDGVAIVYTVAEVEVDGYETSINGFDITNTLITVKDESAAGGEAEDPEDSTDLDAEGGETSIGDGERAPNTATNIYNLALIGLGLILLGLIIFLSRRKRLE